MTKLDKHTLLEQLAAHGYPLMQPVHRSDPETVLEYLLRQRESRLLEGFPVVFLSALRDKAHLRWELPDWKPEKRLGAAASRRLGRLLAVSDALFRLFGIEQSLQERARHLLLKCRQAEETLRQVETRFLKSGPLAMDGVELSTERLKQTFRTYYVNARAGTANPEQTQALELELLLSELFTPRQKELLRKRAEGATMTPTEKTYFYRTVRKRLKALANEDVHALARRLL